jgi:competence protein ComEC
MRFIWTVLAIWLILFSLRSIQVGGLNPYSKEPFSPPNSLDFMQSAFSDEISELMPPLQAALLQGMLLGEQKQLPITFKDDLKSTSVIHMVVVSGQNLTILGAFIMSLSSVLGRKKTAVITLAVITFYSILTGLGIPVIRSAIMAGLTFSAQILGRERSAVWTLSVAAGGMLLYDPNFIFNISFQLSFLATVGVIIMAPVVNKHLTKVPKIIRQDLSSTLSAQALTLPVIAYNFGQLSLIGVIANLFLLWTVPFIMIIGGFSLFTSYINLFLGQVMGLIPSILLTYFIYIVEIFAHLPLASVKIPSTNLYLWAGYYCLVAALIMVLLKDDKNKVTRRS